MAGLGSAVSGGGARGGASGGRGAPSVSISVRSAGVKSSALVGSVSGPEGGSSIGAALKPTYEFARRAGLTVPTPHVMRIDTAGRSIGSSSPKAEFSRPGVISNTFSNHVYTEFPGWSTRTERSSSAQATNTSINRRGIFERSVAERQLPSMGAIGEIGHLIDQSGGTARHTDVRRLLQQSDAVILPPNRDGSPEVRANTVSILPNLPRRASFGQETETRVLSQPSTRPARTRIEVDFVSLQRRAIIGELSSIDVITQQRRIPSAEITEVIPSVPLTVQGEPKSAILTGPIRENMPSSGPREFSWIRGSADAAIYKKLKEELDEKRNNKQRFLHLRLLKRVKEAQQRLTKPYNDPDEVQKTSVQPVQVPNEERQHLVQQSAQPDLALQRQGVDAQILRQTGLTAAPAVSLSELPANADFPESGNQLQTIIYESRGVQQHPDTEIDDLDLRSQEDDDNNFVRDEDAARASERNVSKAIAQAKGNDDDEVSGHIIVDIASGLLTGEEDSQITIDEDGALYERFRILQQTPLTKKAKMDNLNRRLIYEIPPVRAAKQGKKVSQKDVHRVWYGYKTLDNVRQNELDLAA